MSAGHLAACGIAACQQPVEVGCTGDVDFSKGGAASVGIDIIGGGGVVGVVGGSGTLVAVAPENVRIEAWGLKVYRAVGDAGVAVV